MESILKVGVPQGSVLGPLLFLLYINDLPLASNFLTKLFADDTVLIFSSPDLGHLQVQINQELNAIDRWMNSNKLSLNYSKTKYMLIHRRNNRSVLNLYINDKKIEQVKSIEYLGVTIDQDLSWKQHIKTIETKISKACGAICKLHHYVDYDCLYTVYYGHTYSHLQHPCLVWSSAPKSYLKKLDMLHKKLIRLMTLHGSLKELNFSANEMLKNMHILKLEDIYKVELAKFMHNLFDVKVPPTFSNISTKFEDMHKYNLRSTRSKIFFFPR